MSETKRIPKLKNLTAKMTMHMNLGNGGSIYQYECIECPNIVFVDARKKSKDKRVRTVYYKNKEVLNLKQAYDLWLSELKGIVE